MAKNKKNKKKQTNKSAKPSKADNKASAKKIEQDAKEFEAKPKAVGSDDNVKVKLTKCVKERDAKAEELEKLKAREAELNEREKAIDDREGKINCHENLNEREAKLNELEEKIKTESEQNKDRNAELDKRETALDERESEIGQWDKGLKKRENDLLDREDDIKSREIDAEAGFAEKRRESLKQLDAETEILLNDLSNCRKQIAGERAEWNKKREDEETNLNLEFEQKRAEWNKEREDKRADLNLELEQKRHKAEEELDAESEALKNDRNKLKEEERNLREKQREVEWERNLFEEEKLHFDNCVDTKVEAKIAYEMEMLNFKVQTCQERLDAAQEDRNQLQNLLNMRKEADRRFGHKTPDDIFDEMQAIRKERDQLRDQLNSRPGEDAVERLRKLEAKHEDWEKQKTQDLTEIAELKIRLGRAAIGVTEVETLRDQKKALETSRELLQAALEELRTDVEERIRSAEGKSPFPACSGMDKNSNLQTPVRMTDQIDNLADFAHDLQQRIAYDPETKKVLYYSMRDIRSFLGGLAMSHLHLLHGISGTGKTSLPLAFARAVGAGCTLVEVQAGWRDRQDLLGHFNSFERRYYESEFLQALYQAQCPAFQNRLYIVVLDEMNLSHPEQYFADMLSALEKPDEKDRLLSLMTAPVESAPYLLKEGRKLWIPSNVWFVGTANHDETTKDFADKTYDRSHVMELPRHLENFQINMQLDSRQPIAYNVLKQAFEKAKEQYSDKADNAYRLLERELGEILGKSFRVGWGNRLERQMEDYVPVVIAAGGSIGEATDHILATKILRKIRDRYENEDRKDELRKLKHKIEDSWSGLYPKGEFEKLIKDEEVAVKHKAKRSLGIISYELRRLGEDEGS